MKGALKYIPEDFQKTVKQEKQPEWIDPMLAKLTKDVFSDTTWIYEVNSMENVSWYLKMEMR